MQRGKKEMWDAMSVKNGSKERRETEMLLLRQILNSFCRIKFK